MSVCTQGLASCLEEEFGAEECEKKGVVVGYDARHNSHRFSSSFSSILSQRYHLSLPLHSYFLSFPSSFPPPFTCPPLSPQVCSALSHNISQQELQSLFLHRVYIHTLHCKTSKQHHSGLYCCMNEVCVVHSHMQSKSLAVLLECK